MEAILKEPSRLYNPSRDLANLWPELLRGLALDLSRLTPASPAGRLAERLGVTPVAALDALAAVGRAFGIAGDDGTPNATPRQLIEAAGVTAFPPEVLAVVLARLGERVVAVALAAYRDALMDDARWTARSIPDVIAAAVA